MIARCGLSRELWSKLLREITSRYPEIIFRDDGGTLMALNLMADAAMLIAALQAEVYHLACKLAAEDLTSSSRR